MECSIGTQMRKQSVSDVKSTEPRSDLGSLSPIKRCLVTVVLWLVGSIHLDIDVGGLILCERRQLGSKALQVQTRDFFIQLFAEHLNIWDVKAMSETRFCP